MFENCENFNQPLNNWDIENINIDEMFQGCTDYNQGLCHTWDLATAASAVNTFCNISRADTCFHCEGIHPT